MSSNTNITVVQPIIEDSLNEVEQAKIDKEEEDTIRDYWMQICIEQHQKMCYPLQPEDEEYYNN